MPSFIICVWLCVCGAACRPAATREDQPARPDTAAAPPAPAAPTAESAVAPPGPGRPPAAPAAPDTARAVQAPAAGADSGFVELRLLDTAFVLDMRYATAGNFLKEKVYDCGKCLLRKDAALALVQAHRLLKKLGYRLRLFDCYRPLDVQKKMWKIMPDDRFVGNPYGNGSMHNKGAAVDLTLADSTGRELDMGTPFDFFGREAYHAYTQLPAEVLGRRRLLKQVMQQAGFSPITSEWWHYSYSRRQYPVANFKPACP